MSISTTTPIFVPIQQFFNFTTPFTTHVTTYFTTNHYHNWGVNIYYNTNFCSNPTIFQFYHTFYHKFYHKPLPLLPPTTFSVPKRNTGKCFERPAVLPSTPPTTFSVLKRNTGKCLLVFSMPAEILYFFISELRAKVQDGCKDFGDNLVGVGVLTIRF